MNTPKDRLIGSVTMAIAFGVCVGVGLDSAALAAAATLFGMKYFFEY